MNNCGSTPQLTHAAVYFLTGCCLYKKKLPNSILVFFLKFSVDLDALCIIILSPDHGKAASSLVIYLPIFFSLSNCIGLHFQNNV